ncbi:hypothetical protein BJX99DRAFT_265729 [Aspergillus californicus]
MANNFCSDNGTLFSIPDTHYYETELLSMPRRPSTSPDHVQLYTPPLTPPPSPALDNGLDGLAMLPFQIPSDILKFSARLAIECYHHQQASNATLPKTALYEYSRTVAEDELSEEELYILSIFTWDVNASVPVNLFLQQSVQLAEPSIELSDSDREELSNSFSPIMININCTKFSNRYSHFVGFKLGGQAFQDKTSNLLDSLDYSLIAFLIAERALNPRLRLPIDLRHYAQPALESFYKEEKLDVPTEFIQFVLDDFTPLVLAILSLFTLDVTPSACRDAIKLSQHERSLLGRSIQEPRIDQIWDRFLKQEPAKQVRLAFVVRELPSRLKLMFQNCDQCDIGPVDGQSV